MFNCNVQSQAFVDECIGMARRQWRPTSFAIGHEIPPLVLRAQGDLELQALAVVRALPRAGLAALDIVAVVDNALEASISKAPADGRPWELVVQKPGDTEALFSSNFPCALQVAVCLGILFRMGERLLTGIEAVPLGRLHGPELIGGPQHEGGQWILPQIAPTNNKNSCL